MIIMMLYDVGKRNFVEISLNLTFHDEIKIYIKICLIPNFVLNWTNLKRFRAMQSIFLHNTIQHHHLVTMETRLKIECLNVCTFIGT